MTKLNLGIVLVLAFAFVLPLTAVAQETDPVDDSAAAEMQEDIAAAEESTLIENYAAGADEFADIATNASRSTGELVIPTDLTDASFDKYVDLALICDGIASMDASLLTDVALQVRNGERILLRPRKKVNSDTLLDLALRVAQENQDRSALARLAKAAKELGDEQLAARIEAAQKMAGESRTAVPAMVVPVDGTSAEAFRRYKELLKLLKRGRLLGDRHLLETVAEEASMEQALTEEQREYVKSLVEESRAAIAETDDTSEALRALASASRQLPNINLPELPSPIPNPFSGGQHSGFHDHMGTATYYGIRVHNLSGVTINYRVYCVFGRAGGHWQTFSLDPNRYRDHHSTNVNIDMSLDTDLTAARSMTQWRFSGRRPTTNPEHYFIHRRGSSLYATSRGR